MVNLFGLDLIVQNMVTGNLAFGIQLLLIIKTQPYRLSVYNRLAVIIVTPYFYRTETFYLCQQSLECITHIGIIADKSAR